MVYHAVSAPNFSVNDSEAWCKGLTADSGNKFAKFCRVPGMGHSSGGPATDLFDMVVSARGAGNAGGVNTDWHASWAPDRPHPLCAGPKVMHYRANASLETASGFNCE